MATRQERSTAKAWFGAALESKPPAYAELVVLPTAFVDGYPKELVVGTLLGLLLPERR